MDPYLTCSLDDRQSASTETHARSRRRRLHHRTRDAAADVTAKVREAESSAAFLSDECRWTRAGVGRPFPTSRATGPNSVARASSAQRAARGNGVCRKLAHSRRDGLAGVQPSPSVILRAMGDPDRRRRSRSGRVLDALIWGGVLGAAGGAVLGDAADGVGAALGAGLGALLYAPAEALTSLHRTPAEPKPIWQRIFASALLTALFGWLLGLLYDAPLFIALVSGALLGVLGLRLLKLALGLVVGASVGALFAALDGGAAPALVAAAVAIVYRGIAAVAYRERPLVRVMAEEVPASELRYVVPFEARSRYVGGDYVEQLAKARGGTFRRNPPDVGILASLDSLDGPTFDASKVHPLIREFYEHTSRFKLSIVPEWRRWMKPGYEVFKRVVAEPLGQAAIPSNIEEAQRGMVSTIDTIDLDDDDVIDIRGWIRTFADSGKPIYVGIYTSFRHDGRGYVSVGFPIPSSNFTATLLPHNAGEHDLVLTSRTELAYPGHYLSAVDSERDALTVLKLLAFNEEIHVYVVDDELRTDHSFSLAGQRFLTL